MNQMQKYESGGLVPGNQPGQDVSLKEASVALLKNWKIIILVTGLSIGVAAIATVKMKKVWEANAQLVLVQKDPRTPASQNQSQFDAPMFESIETQLDLIQNPAMAVMTLNWIRNDAFNRGQTTSQFNITPEEIQRAVVVTNPKNTDLLDIAVREQSPERARFLANAISMAFVGLKQDMARHNIQATEESLVNRVAISKAQTLALNKQLNDFKEKNKVVDIPSQERATLDLMQQRETDIAALQLELTSQQARLNSLQTRMAAVNSHIAKSGVRDDAMVQLLGQQLAQAEVDRATAAEKYTTAYPGVLSGMDQKIAMLKKKLSDAVSSSVGADSISLQSQGAMMDDFRQTQTAVVFTQAKLNAAKQLRDGLKSRIAAYPKLDMDYQTLANSALLAANLYARLQGNLDDARLAKDKINGNVQIAQVAAVSDLPVSPRPLINMVLGTVIGLVLSALIIMVREQKDDKVRSSAGIRRLSVGPVIGSLPTLSNAQLASLSLDGTMPSLVDPYSLAAANLNLAVRRATDRDLMSQGVLLVTSAVPGEGKSVSAAQLARSVSRSGKRVILVDADLRRPSQGKLFHNETAVGLANVLAGEVPLRSIIQGTEIGTLSVVYSGQTEYEPASLILTPKMREVIEHLRQMADFVIIDTPACAVVPEALYIAPFVDCILHVIGVGRVDEQTLMRTIESLESTGKPRACLVTNAEDERPKTNYQSYYASSKPHINLNKTIYPSGLSGEPVHTAGSAKSGD